MPLGALALRAVDHLLQWVYSSPSTAARSGQTEIVRTNLGPLREDTNSMGKCICRKCGVTSNLSLKNTFCTSCQHDAEGMRIYDRAGAPIPGVMGYEARVQLQTEEEKRLVEETRAAIRAHDSRNDRRLKERVERQDPKALDIQAAKRKSRDQWDQFSDNREKINAKRYALKAGMKEISAE